MAVSPAVIKAIVVAATDKRTWTAVGSVICGVIMMIVIIVAAFLNIFFYDDSGSSTAPTAYVQFINDMKYAYRKLDRAADELCPSLDKEQMHAIFYTLYFGEEKNQSEQFYRDFVECFITRTTDEEGDKAVNRIGNELTEKSIEWQRLLPENKDWNEDLAELRVQEQTQDFDLSM